MRGERWVHFVWFSLWGGSIQVIQSHVLRYKKFSASEVISGVVNAWQQIGGACKVKYHQVTKRRDVFWSKRKRHMSITAVNPKALHRKRNNQTKHTYQVFRGLYYVDTVLVVLQVRHCNHLEGDPMVFDAVVLTDLDDEDSVDVI